MRKPEGAKTQNVIHFDEENCTRDQGSSSQAVLENIPIPRRLAISHKKNSRWMETTDSETPNLETSPKKPLQLPT
jgi:hypothetical protein